MLKKFLFIMLSMMPVILACGRKPADKMGPEMRQQLDGLPQDANVVFYLDMEKITNSQIYYTLDLENRIPDEQLDEFKTGTGLDIRKDINQLYWSMLIENDQEPKDIFFIAKGTFDPDKITGYIESQDKTGEITMELYKEDKIWGLDFGEWAFCFKDEQTLIGGSPESVRQWLDGTLDSFQTPADPGTVRKMVSNLDYVNCAWIVVNTAILYDHMEDSDSPYLQGLQGAQKVMAGLDMTDILRFQGVVQCIDEENATLFHDSIKGGIAAIKLSDTSDRKFIDFMNKIKILQSQNNVQLTFKYTAEEVQKVMEKKDLAL